MENINQICRKIIQGPQNSQTNVTTNAVSGFLEILASMSQSTEVISDLTIGTSLIPDELIEVPKQVETNSEISPELLQMLMNQMVVQMNQSQIVEVVEPDETSVIPITNDNQTTGPINCQISVPVETSPIKLVETSNLNKSIFEVESNVNVPTEVVEVIKETNSDEIQKHYKVMNHSLKFKETYKSTEQNSLNTNFIKPTNVQEKKEVVLNDVELNQFRQSIEEMRMNFVNTSNKEDETIVFKLKPEGLAEIVVKFEHKFGKVTLDISTSNKIVEQLIQKELPQLKDALKSYQMEVNLNEMGYHEQANQSQHYKPHRQMMYQMDDTFEQVSDEELIHEWIDWSKPNGLNTYV